jgi:putative DNA primase/helicase
MATISYIVRMPRREDYCTKSTSVQPDPNCEIPRWSAFLDTVIGGDQELKSYLQRVAGYCCTGLTREQVFFFFYGPGGNGKGVFIRTLAGILGDYAITTPIETFLETRNERHPTELARLRGARLIIAGEPEEGRRWNESLLKKFTGGESIEARFMRGDFFDYIPQGKLIFSGNHRPGLKSVNEAIRRRLHLIPFSVIIPAAERDLKLEEKLRREWPGILHWMVEGLMAWQREGLNPPKAVLDASADYLATEDVLGRFLEENADIGNPKAWEFSSRLWNRWKKWTEEGNEFTGTQKDFVAKLRQRLDGGRNSQGVFYKGIALIDSSPM